MVRLSLKHLDSNQPDDVAQLYEDPSSAPVTIRAEGTEIKVHTEVLNDFFKQTIAIQSDNEDEADGIEEKVIKLPSRFGPVLEIYRGYMYSRPIEIEMEHWKLFCELIVFTTVDDALDEPVTDEATDIDENYCEAE